jgi:flagellar biosynthesis chaperone FliJ
MQLTAILSGFSKVKNQLAEFIEDKSEVNKKLEEELQVGVSEVK